MTNLTDKNKSGQPLLWNLEQKLINKYTPKLPHFINGYNLTWFNLLWSVGILFSGIMAVNNINWLWLMSFFIFMQWLTDSFDGAVGRYRNSGLIKWGYYMDHLFDYIFMAVILLSYSMIMPKGHNFEIFMTLIIFSAFMINSYLTYGATGKLQIAYLRIGPTEIRILFVIINTLLIIFGRTYMAFVLPYFFVMSALGLFLVIYRTQKKIYDIDMRNKMNKKNQEKY